MTRTPPANEQITQLLTTVRRRWRLRRVLRALTGFAFAIGAIVLIAVLVMNSWYFAPAVVTGVKLTSYALLVVAFGFLIGPPLVQRVSRTRLALYVEEHEPSLAMALASAAELERPDRQTLSPTLEHGLLQQALIACRTLDDGRRVDRRKLRRAGAHLAIAVASLILLMVLLPANLQHGVKLLLLPGNKTLAANPYRLSIEPGRITSYNVCYTKLLRKAAAQLQRMLAINAESYEAHLKLAGLHETLGDSAGAADALARALYIYPFEPDLHERLAGLYEKAGNWQRAIQERKAVVALKPVDMAQARYRLAHAHARAGQLV